MVKLLEALNSMNTALRPQKEQNAVSTSINIISSFVAFDPKVESFKNYKERLEIYFQLKNIFADKSYCNTLDHQIMKSYDFTSSYKTSLTYFEIVIILESCFCPKENILVEQHKFLLEIQNEDQNITDFVTVLQKRASSCKFMCECAKLVNNIFLRAQFIRGLRM